MKKNKNSLFITLIYAILFVTYNLIVFLVFKNKGPVFWMSYFFMIMAFVAQLTSMRLSFKSTDVETIFFGIPLASLSVYYLFAQFFCSLAFMIFQIIGMKIAFLIQIIMFVAFLIVAIISLMARDAVQDISSNIKEKVTSIKSMSIDIQMIMEICSDKELKANLKKLAETVKYSDPMSNESVYDIELRIKERIFDLRNLCDDQNYTEAKIASRDIELLFRERNKKLLISK